MLAKLQIWFFERGSTKDHLLWEKMGNFTQDLRTHLENKKE